MFIVKYRTDKDKGLAPYEFICNEDDLLCHLNLLEESRKVFSFTIIDTGWPSDSTDLSGYNPHCVTFDKFVLHKDF